jgi:hypothetical protein
MDHKGSLKEFATGRPEGTTRIYREISILYPLATAANTYHSLDRVFAFEITLQSYFTVRNSIVIIATTMALRNDPAIADVSSAMEGIEISVTNDNGNSSSIDGVEQSRLSGLLSTPLSPVSSLLSPNPNSVRPLDRVAMAGAPAAPITFPKARFERGRRDNVCIYDSNTGSHKIAKGVLFRDYSREFGENADRALSRVKQAYWPVPYKSNISTIMGHVEICVILLKCSKEACSDDEANSESGNSEAEADDDDDDDDVVFQVTNRHVAVKVNYSSRMEKYRDRHAENPLYEIAAMQLIGNANPHVMGIVEVLFDGENLNVVMPYAGSGDLFQMLQDSQETGTGFTEGEARFWFRQIIDGVRYLHSRGVCHRDLSPENIMLAADDALIIDMGMAILVPYTDPTSTTGGVTDKAHGTKRRMILPQGACGKLPYMSPEIYRSRKPFDGGAVDIWTAGTILFCMVTGNRSYARPQDSDAQFYWMTHGLSRLLRDWGVHLSPECVHLLKHMLQIDPRLRLTLDEVICHPWFERPDEPPRSAMPLESVGR